MGKSEYLIIDAGFFVALGNKKDQHYKKANEILDFLPKRQWITTWPVLAEVCHLLATKYPNNLLPFLKNLEQEAFAVFDLTQKDHSGIYQFMLKYRDLPIDLADASLLILANHLGHGDIVSTDSRNFKTYRWKNQKPFHNLFESLNLS